jgi:glutamate dehydrogenase/leucine dehydrogenase
MSALLQQTPGEIAAMLQHRGPGRVCFVRDPGGALRASDPSLQTLGDEIARLGDYAEHEAVFLAVGPETGALFGAFVHRTTRGQALGGLRHWPYPDFEAYLRDGLRLAVGMGRKAALAGLWWGGGKGIIARQPGDGWCEADYRSQLYAEYGRFVTSLRGAYVTGEDAGTTPSDMAVIYRHTRFATCVPCEVGGSGNPSDMTAAGVVCAIRAALDFTGAGPLAGKRIAMQGAGNVGSCMIERLLAEGIGELVVSETSAEQREVLLDRFSSSMVEVRAGDLDDGSILAEHCDVLVPNALGAVLNEKSIPGIRAPIVCGAANNQLADEQRDARALANLDIVWVPDFVANRMGIVACSNEHAGSLPGDPLIEQHLDADWPGGIHRVTQRILTRARDEGMTTLEAANALAAVHAEEPHPIWGNRAQRIIDALYVEHRRDGPLGP